MQKPFSKEMSTFHKKAKTNVKSATAFFYYRRMSAYILLTRMSEMGNDNFSRQKKTQENFIFHSNAKIFNI